MASTVVYSLYLLTFVHKLLICLLTQLLFTNVQATMVMPRSVVVTWTVSSSPDVTGYIISYTTTASYTSGGSVRVNQRTTTRGTIMNLEEATAYIITVQATTSDNTMSGNSNAVSVTTSSVGK